MERNIAPRIRLRTKADLEVTEASDSSEDLRGGRGRNLMVVFRGKERAVANRLRKKGTALVSQGQEVHLDGAST